MFEVFYQNKKVRCPENINDVVGKTCSTCKTFKSYEEYCISFKDGFNYLYPQCNSCKANSLKVWRKDNFEKTLFSGVKARAKRQNLEFDLEVEDIIIPSTCPILGLKLERTLKRSDLTPTVDRINPLKGYTKDNIVICSWRANKLKSDGTFDEIDAIHRFLVNSLKSE